MSTNKDLPIATIPPVVTAVERRDAVIASCCLDCDIDIFIPSIWTLELATVKPPGRLVAPVSSVDMDDNRHCREDAVN
jgi:hypothetical protein